jgi:tryptophan synthase beta chain
VPQAFCNKEAGTKALTTETGAGQWGAAQAMARSFFDIDLEVYRVKVSYQQKPYRRSMMANYGATVYASPSDHTHYGHSILAQDPNSPGSLGIAISEAVEAAASSGGAKKYSLGSVLGHVLTEGPDRHRPGSLAADGVGGRVPRLRHRLHAGVGTLRDFAGFSYPFLHQNLTAGKTSKTRACVAGRCHRRRAGQLPKPDPRPICFRLWRRGRDGPHRQDVHARPHLCPAGRRSTPAGCATTAWRRVCLPW